MAIFYQGRKYGHWLIHNPSRFVFTLCLFSSTLAKEGTNHLTNFCMFYPPKPFFFHEKQIRFLFLTWTWVFLQNTICGFYTHNIYYYSQLTHLTISFSDAVCTFILLYMCSILSDLEINHVHLYYYILQRHKDCWVFFMAIFYQGRMGFKTSRKLQYIKT
jgi:hypothetical protein